MVAIVIPHFDGWIECCYEEFWSFRCAYDVASAWYGVQFVSFMALHFDYRILDSALEEGSMVWANVVVFSFEVVGARCWYEFFHGRGAVRWVGAAL